MALRSRSVSLEPEGLEVDTQKLDQLLGVPLIGEVVRVDLLDRRFDGGAFGPPLCTGSCSSYRSASHS